MTALTKFEAAENRPYTTETTEGELLV